MARANRILAYTCVKSEGSILPYDLLARVASADRILEGVKPEDYHLGPNERFGEVVSRSWSRLTGAWKSLREALEKLGKNDPAVRVTRERFLLPLFQELGYGRLQTANALDVDGKSYPISHVWQQTPIHLLGWGVDLDKRQRGIAGAAQSSPHGLVQDLLNRSDAHLWGLLANGHHLRVLRDHQSLTRQAYVEFDLEAMFDGELYGEFLLLWLICHESRVEADKPSHCWLEKWFQTSRSEGVQAHTKLRQGVEAAICALGSGLVQHPKSEALRHALQSGTLTPLELYRQILRVVYRLLFVLVAEDRGALHPPLTPDLVRKRYQKFYSLRRLRDPAAARRGGPHADLWQQLCLVQSQLIEGYEPLGLPALGSYLWSHEAAPWPMESTCSNQHLLAAITHLTTVPADKGRGRLPVNFRTLGAEELGSIYEGLLELQPVVNAETGQFELGGSQGNERKTTGSYYTPSSLVDCLLDSALDPVLDEACKKPDPVAALLELKIVDPACGSGHFLVAAARRLAKRLAAARSGEDEPSPEAVQHALRDVIGRCIYGVDLNPMAVELCKVALWVEALEPGRPLSFLEAHIQCGNSLLGTTAELLSRKDGQGRRVGIPDEAFVVLEGDDANVTAELKKRNKKDRGGDILFGSLGEPIDFKALGSQMRAVEARSDDTLRDVKAKAAQYGDYLKSSAFRQACDVADAWCAAFMWKKVPGAPVLGNSEFQALEGGRVLPQATMDEIATLTARFKFFHMHLSFPEVFARGGFDLVLGNPPWETIEVPDDADLYARRDVVAIQHAVAKMGTFPYAGTGRKNLYALFVELASRLSAHRDHARVGLVVPTEIVQGADTEGLSRSLFEGRRVHSLCDLQNRRKSGERWFPAVHPQYRFALLTLARNVGVAQFAFDADSPVEIGSPEKAYGLSVEDILSFCNKDSFRVPMFMEPEDARIMAAAYRGATLLGDWPLLGSGLMFNFGQTERAAKVLATESYRPECYFGVLEGENIHQFDHRFALDDGSGRSRRMTDLEKADPTTTAASQHLLPRVMVLDRINYMCENPRRWFVVLRRQARANDSWVAIAAVIPICAVEGSLTTFFGTAVQLVRLVAAFNTFLTNFILARRQSGPNVNKGMYGLLPMHFDNRHLPGVGPWSDWLLPRVLELTYTAWDLQAFAQDVGYNGPPFRWDPARRFLLRCELDTAFFHLYGLNRDDTAYIMDTFPIVRKNDVKAHGEFRTKRVILEIFDEMADAARMGTAYVTRLVPGPADGAVAHPDTREVPA